MIIRKPSGEKANKFGKRARRQLDSSSVFKKRHLMQVTTGFNDFTTNAMHVPVTTPANLRLKQGDTTPTIPIIDGRNTSGSIAVTYFIVGSLVLAALYYVGRNAYHTLKLFCMELRNPQKKSEENEDTRKISSTKLMVKEELE